MASTTKPAPAQQGDAQTTPAQQGQSSAPVPQQQGAKTIFKDWASI